MVIFKEIGPLRAYFSENGRHQLMRGFVPTMGALHQGHLELIKTSKRDNAITVCSIFVNPTQFNNPSDLEKYPRTVEKDIAQLEAAGCDVLFCPEREEMYQKTSTLQFDFGKLDKVFEGEFRPGHFSGVALVVSKLFNIVVPNRAYFGQKDFQQFKIISRLVEELNFALELICVPTQRESNGLAMSSRNLRLTAEQRTQATVFYRSLVFAKTELQAGMDFKSVHERVAQMCAREPGVKLEYFTLADRENLNRLESVNEASRSILLLAGFVAGIRLIDNMFVEA